MQRVGGLCGRWLGGLLGVLELGEKEGEVEETWGTSEVPQWTPSMCELASFSRLVGDAGSEGGGETTAIANAAM